MSEETIVEDNTRDQGVVAADFLTTILSLSGIETTITASEESNRIRLNVTPVDSDDIGLIVGVQGRTRNSYQLLLNRMIGKRFDRDSSKPVSIDVGGLIEEREERLGEMAKRIAESARSQTMQIELTGMNAADRRMVHMALSEESDLSTYSTNEGIARRLVIVG